MDNFKFYLATATAVAALVLVSVTYLTYVNLQEKDVYSADSIGNGYTMNYLN